MTQTISREEVRLRDELARRGLSFYDYDRNDHVLYLRLDATHSKMTESEISAAVNEALAHVDIEHLFPGAESYTVMGDEG